jgi:hypothetical protein
MSFWERGVSYASGYAEVSDWALNCMHLELFHLCVVSYDGVNVAMYVWVPYPGCVLRETLHRLHYLIHMHCY